MAEAVTRITSPMCVVVGAVDPAVPRCAMLNELVPHSEFHSVPGAPHNVYYEAADRYNTIVDAFLARVAAPAGVR